LWNKLAKPRPKRAVPAVSEPRLARKNPNRGCLRPAAARSVGTRPGTTVVAVGSLFFPHSHALGIEPDDTLSPGVLKKVVYAGATAVSFQQAERDLAVEAELSISCQRIMRATKRIGEERLRQRQAAAKAWRRLPLPMQWHSPHEHVPTLAVVEVDGGRIQIRERKGPESDDKTASSFWRETKVATLLRMHSKTSVEDPCPQLPESFANIARMAQLSREIKGFSAAAVKDEEAPGEKEQARPGRPQVLLRNVVAMRGPPEAFAAQVALTAWESGFAATPRKAFVADGQATNWTVWRLHFSHYTPVLDFVHAVCYVFNAAAAGRPLDDVAAVYRRWAQWTWSGQVARVIAELEARLDELGPPRIDDGESHPRTVVAEALGYLRNQQHRMRYDAYRRQGLPITSAHVESTIKQINRRVKGSEKFWSEAGAAALLQLSADYLSERMPLDKFWNERAGNLRGMRCYF
jgi:hypothetical protein